MRRTMFEAGFNSPTHGYGLQVPTLGRGPELGSVWSDIKDFFHAPAKAATTPAVPPVPPPPQPSGTVLGIPTEYVLIGGGVALILGLVAAVVGSKKSGPAPVPPKPQVGRRRR